MEIEEYDHYSPLSAALAGRDEVAQTKIYESLNALPDEVSDVLIDVSTAEKIQQWAIQGVFPSSHSTAISKIIALVLLGEIPPLQVPNLLSKINLDPEVVQHTTDAISSITAPALAFKQGYEKTVTLGSREVSPLTMGAKSMDNVTSPQAGAQGIIDLRKPPQPNA